MYFLLSRICFVSIGLTLAKNQLNSVTIFSWSNMSVFFNSDFSDNDDLFIPIHPLSNEICHTFPCLFCITQSLGSFLSSSFSLIFFLLFQKGFYMFCTWLSFEGCGLSNIFCIIFVFS